MLPSASNNLSEEELSEVKKYEALIRTMNKMDAKAYRSQLNLRHTQERNEKDIEARLTTDLEMAEMREYKREQNERLAAELDRQNRLCLRDAKFRQQIRANTDELRDLEVKLRAGYVGKAIRAQLAEHKATREMERQQQLRDQEQRHAAQQAEAEHRLAQKAKQCEQKASFRHALQEQIMNKRDRQQLLYKEFLAEKQQIDALVRRVYEEQIW